MITDFPPRFRIEHRRSDVAPGVVGFGDDFDRVMFDLLEMRRKLREADADGTLVVIDQLAEPEAEVESYRVDNRVSTR